ncbi:hypothetical protein [Sporolactobacillus vineae]|uniref:hypothetical protein n=1 Tax=Sporolactobacillus vineae TaxID=444463 RepID=UPI0002897315|nr:hypothetical protein [Sporolactobacillus vineae]
MDFFWGTIEFLSLVALIIGLFWRFSKKNKENVVKKKQGRNIAIIGFVALFASGLIMSNIQDSKAQQTNIKGKTLTYKQMTKDISELKATKNDLNDQKLQLQTDISSLSSNLSDLKNNHKDVMNAIKHKDTLSHQVAAAEDSLSGLKSDISDAKDELSSVNNQIKSANDNLAKAKGQVTAAKGAPKVLQAGQYVTGNDVPAGRYKATPVGSGSNFIIHDSDGMPVVNTILGSDGEASYTFETTDGDQIQTESAVKLTPIK